MRALVVEDDAGITRAIERGLERERCQAEVAHDGPTGLERAQTEPFSLIILDIILPVMDGLRISEELRSGGSGVPILMPTAKGAVPDRLRGPARHTNKTRVPRGADLATDTQAHQVTGGGAGVMLTRGSFHQE